MGRETIRPHQAGRVYMGTRPVMAIDVACEVLVCRVWHVCGGRIGSAHRRVGGACKHVSGACVARVWRV
jgi:hypothetical protein